MQLKPVSFKLEVIAIVLAVFALLYRATMYWHLPIATGEAYGLGDLLDFGLALALFLICILCAAAGVALSTKPDPEQHRLAFRPVLVGILSFVVYYFLHPYVPRLI